ncbi:MAG: 16S rRNA (cytidine(1402)-2'-O)-methyltransferase [Oscillospiraceae bacterium]|nr:16S rRNA (cytidine(1402)-2'-O)-methyltransferase [Oscillospiraceae bacterium]
MHGKLYIVSTPIGNMEDITHRAELILEKADIIAAEDTRRAKNLLGMLGIKNKTVSNHKFNERSQSEFLISMLLEGKDVAIVSDAGTPCISDPGYIIVREASAAGIEVVGVCGASAVTTALSVSGYNITSFAFYGFFPRANKEIREIMDRIKNSGIYVSVFFESPMRIENTLAEFAERFPDGEICLCNDISKLHERIYRGRPQEVLEEIRSNPNSQKGEYTIVIQTKPESEEQTDTEPQSLEAALIDYAIKNGVSIKKAVQALHEQQKIPKKELYSAAVNLKESREMLFP